MVGHATQAHAETQSAHHRRSRAPRVDRTTQAHKQPWRHNQLRATRAELVGTHTMRIKQSLLRGELGCDGLGCGGAGWGGMW